MKIVYRKSFLKELSKIPSETRLKMEIFVFEELPKANSIFEVGTIEQMKGYRSYYKVRFGSYRIGLKLENDKVIMEKALHRKDIYRYFP
jgi:mRNA interferase RelE/StbE